MYDKRFVYRVREILRECKLAERVRTWDRFELSKEICIDETVVKGYHRKAKPGRRVAVSKVLGLVACAKHQQDRSVRIALTESLAWSVMLPFCCLCAPPDGVARTSMLMLCCSFFAIMWCCLSVVFSDGNPVYAVPSKWNVESGDKITHRFHPHNDPKHPFRDAKDKELTSNPVENVNGLVKTLTLFPSRGCYEPHLNIAIQEFAFHREDGSTKVARYLLHRDCMFGLYLMIGRFWSTIASVRNQMESPVFLDEESVAVYKIAEEHPKLEWMNVPLVERLLFKVKKWSGLDPAETYGLACANVFRVLRLQVSPGGLGVRGRVGSFRKHDESFRVEFGFRQRTFWACFFYFKCSCAVGQKIIKKTGFPRMCKHVVAAMLDCCIDFDGSKGCIVVDKFAKATVGVAEGDDAHVVVERILYRRLMSGSLFGSHINMCKILGERWEDVLWIPDQNFLSWEAHTQYSTLLQRLKTGTLRWWEVS